MQLKILLKCKFSTKSVQNTYKKVIITTAKILLTTVELLFPNTVMCSLLYCTIKPVTWNIKNGHHWLRYSSFLNIFKICWIYICQRILHTGPLNVWIPLISYISYFSSKVFISPHFHCCFRNRFHKSLITLLYASRNSNLLF